MKNLLSTFLLMIALSPVYAAAQNIRYNCEFKTITPGEHTSPEDIIKTTGFLLGDSSTKYLSIDLHTNRDSHATLTNSSGKVNLSVYNGELGAGASAESDMGNPIKVELYRQYNEKRIIIECKVGDE